MKDPLDMHACDNCRYYSVIGSGNGECHRHAPMCVSPAAQNSIASALWPVVSADDFCGDWKTTVGAKMG